MSRARRFPVLAAVVAAVALASCTGEETGPPFREVAGTRLLMASVMEPAADHLWASVGWIITPEGEEKIQPQTDEEWILVRNAAVTLAESGNLLMMDRRKMDDEDWIGWSRDLIDAGDAAMQAADARDVQGEQVYFACAGCHAQYWANDPNQFRQ
ncbi:MAG: hypothetical protein J4F98_14715 [Acidobacteria bacterium]|nr:hypothetical protein [Acidobacteriota bacterium]